MEVTILRPLGTVKKAVVLRFIVIVNYAFLLGPILTPRDLIHELEKTSAFFSFKFALGEDDDIIIFRREREHSQLLLRFPFAIIKRIYKP